MYFSKTKFSQLKSVDLFSNFNDARETFKDVEMLQEKAIKRHWAKWSMEEDPVLAKNRIRGSVPKTKGDF